MKKITLLCLFTFATLLAYADEGMWMLNSLNKQTIRPLKEMGLKLSPKEIYDAKKPSLSDAVVSFGGFCSGVVVSSDGLVFTNHHCGFDAIQQHSSVERNYLEDGFVANSRDEELPNPDLFVRFLLRTEDVTSRVLAVAAEGDSPMAQMELIDSVMVAIQNEVYDVDSTLVAIVSPYYAGNEYWLSVYRDYNDVRLVFAPPSSVGKFGWDTDNWMWPRHTGDFSVFRIYANADNEPADYSPDNVPYHPKYVAPISLSGYKQGDFCMTMGYPGETNRFLSSYGIEEIMNGRNQAMIDLREVKQAIWKDAMSKSEDIRVKYASKYDQSSNYYKNSIGTNKSIKSLKLIEKKQTAEHQLLRWIQDTPNEREQHLHLFTTLELAYKERREPSAALDYLYEAFMNGAELIPLALDVLNFDFGTDDKSIAERMGKLVDRYVDIDIELDKEVFAAMLEEYRSKVGAYLPDFYDSIDHKFNGDYKLFTDSLYASSKLSTPEGFQLFLEQDSTYNVFEDPAVHVSLDILFTMFGIIDETQQPNGTIRQGEKDLNALIRRMYAARNFYPDANSTMRMSYGTVRGYTPYDGAEFNYFTTTKGISEKVRQHIGDPDFEVQPDLLALLTSGDYGRYADTSGEMNVCFISDNDITGGNSGSAMFNGKGELLGLAFDGNWEAMVSDYLYLPAVQRCIGVDVRYMLFMIERWGAASGLIDELKLH